MSSTTTAAHTSGDGSGRHSREHPTPDETSGATAARTIGGARTGWVAAYARGLAASPAARSLAVDELVDVAAHDVGVLVAASALGRDCPTTRALIADALTRLGVRPSDIANLRNRLLENAGVFEDPDVYLAGVEDTFAALGIDVIVDITDDS